MLIFILHFEFYISVIQLQDFLRSIFNLFNYPMLLYHSSSIYIIRWILLMVFVLIYLSSIHFALFSLSIDAKTTLVPSKMEMVLKQDQLQNNIKQITCNLFTHCFYYPSNQSVSCIVDGSEDDEELNKGQQLISILQGSRKELSFDCILDHLPSISIFNMVSIIVKVSVLLLCFVLPMFCFFASSLTTYPKIIR